ncbi:MAG: hypothetical protein QXR03_02340 [Candidatus Aenigmatarchaeota archaeon]
MTQEEILDFLYKNKFGTVTEISKKMNKLKSQIGAQIKRLYRNSGKICFQRIISKHNGRYYFSKKVYYFPKEKAEYPSEICKEINDFVYPEVCKNCAAYNDCY